VTAPKGQDVESSGPQTTMYQPDNGLLMLFTGVFVPLVMPVAALAKFGGDPLAVSSLTAWGCLVGVVALAVGIRRRRTFRAVGGRWPALTPGVVEPVEPFRFLSGNPSKDAAGAGAVSREPLLMVVVGVTAVAAAATYQFLLPADATNGMRTLVAVIGGVFVMIGGGFLVTSVVRLRWMARYRRVVGHSPW
jgi:hypothetical protein